MGEVQGVDPRVGRRGLTLFKSLRLAKDSEGGEAPCVADPTPVSEKVEYERESSPTGEVHLELSLCSL